MELQVGQAAGQVETGPQGLVGLEQGLGEPQPVGELVLDLVVGEAELAPPRPAVAEVAYQRLDRGRSKFAPPISGSRTLS